MSDPYTAATFTPEEAAEHLCHLLLPAYVDAPWRDGLGERKYCCRGPRCMAWS